MPKQHYRADSFRPRTAIGYLLKRSQRLLQDRLERLFGRQECTLQQWVVMLILREGRTITVADLCRELHHDSGAMTRLIDQLEDRKLIERQRNSQDRRVIELSLTDSGHKTVEALIVIAVEALNTALDGFSRDEVKLLESMLRRLIGRLETLEPNSTASTLGGTPEQAP